MPKRPAVKHNTKTTKKTPKQLSLFIFKLIVILGILMSAVVGVVGYNTLNQPYVPKQESETLTVKTGESFNGFIAHLAKEQEIRFPIFLKLYQRFFMNGFLRAGVYEVHHPMRIKHVLKMVSSTDKADMNRIVVVQGSTYKQLIAQLQSNPMVKKTILHLPTDQLLKELKIPEQHPEGLFAPNTYFFEPGETDRYILTDLYQRQQKILQAAWKNRAEDLPYTTPYEALIIASIIEKETNLDRELAEISGVFYRRLKIGMRLQTDPTVIYGMGERYNGNITRKDLQTYTPYNTYRINGLPPSPISMPSEKTIEAALNPNKDSRSLYFVATGKGGHTFSETLEQHNRAVKQYLEVLRQNRLLREQREKEKAEREAAEKQAKVAESSTDKSTATSSE